MSDDDEDDQMDVDRETTPVSNLSNTSQASASGMKQQFEERSALINKERSDMINRVKKENTIDSSFYYNRQNSLKQPETVDNSDIKSIKP
jgi:hypothetical protein